MSNNASGTAKAVDPDLPLTPSGKTFHLPATGEQLADRIILVGDPGRVSVVAGYFDSGSITHEASHREIIIITGKYHGVPVSVLSTGMGTDNVEIIMNEIHILKEYDISQGRWRSRKGDSDATGDIFDPTRVKIIRVGTCGSPNSELSVGCLAITRHSVGLDNTCQYYQGLGGNESDDVKEVLAKVKTTSLSKIQVYATKASPAITEALVSACKSFTPAAGEGGARQPLAFYVGTTCSASGFYGCQGRSVGRFAKHLTVPHLTEELGDLVFHVAGGDERVANLEMETSALCYLSSVLGYQAGTVCMVLARRSRTERAFATPEQCEKGLANAITVALNAITSMPDAKM